MFVKTLNITDSVSNIVTSTTYKYYWVRNLGAEDVSVFRAFSDIDTNKKIVLSQNENIKIIPENNNIYFKSSSTGSVIEIYGTNTEICPFKIMEKSESGDDEIEPPGGWIKDGKAHYWVDIITENTPIPVRVIADQYSESNAVIDWGDGSLDTVSPRLYLDLTHIYTNTGIYMITITSPDDRTVYINRFGSSLESSPAVSHFGDLLFVEQPTTPESITSIGDSAFMYCTSLVSMTIPEGVTSIDSNAFNWCTSLTSVTIPESVTSIKNNAFSHCTSLASIVIPEGVTSISNYTFNDCASLTSVTLPKNVTSIGYNAFYNCYSLTSITIPEGVTSINDNTFNNCYSLISIIIPKNVTVIYGQAFKNCTSLRSITISEGVKNISMEAFSNCWSLMAITIPESVISVGNEAFKNCYSLRKGVILGNITSIGSGTFSGCYSLTSITIPESVTSISNSAFYNCYSLTSITIPEGVTSIGSSAFDGCSSLTSITIPEGVTSIGSSAFHGCSSLQSMTVLAATPPTLAKANAIPTTLAAIYVPADSVDAYKAATTWSIYASKIQAIPA